MRPPGYSLILSTIQFLYHKTNDNPGGALHGSMKVLGAIFVSLAILVAAMPQTLALAPATAPGWKVNDFWDYQGTFLWTNISVSLNVTGKGDISIDSATYHVYTLEFYIKATLGVLTYTLSGKEYYDQTDYSLIKIESTTVEKGQVQNNVIIYDPPVRQVNFPLVVGKQWDDNRTVTTSRTVNGVTTTTKTNESDSYYVEGTDSIVTPGGAMECFRISVTNKTGSNTKFWYSAQIGQFVKLDVIPALSNNYVTLVDYSYTAPKAHGSLGPLQGSWITPAILIIVIIVVIIIIVVAARSPRGRAKLVTPSSTVQPTTASAPVPLATPIAQPAPQPPKPQGMIEDVFLVYRDGRLIHHDARRLKPEVDQDVLGGMLTAIQDFVNKSFPSSDGTAGTVKEIRYANNRILLEKGQFVYIAVVTDFPDTTALQARMLALVKLMEVKCASELQNWDGNMESVAEAKRLSRLMLTEEPIPSS